jgi:hypothetical protein
MLLLISAPAIDFSVIQDTAALKVDLRKAQTACEKLSEQLVQAEAARDEFEKLMAEAKEEADVARKVKESTLKDKHELEKKHEVRPISTSIEFNWLPLCALIGAHDLL